MRLCPRTGPHAGLLACLICSGLVVAQAPAPSGSIQQVTASNPKAIKPLAPVPLNAIDLASRRKSKKSFVSRPSSRRVLLKSSRKASTHGCWIIRIAAHLLGDD